MRGASEGGRGYLEASGCASHWSAHLCSASIRVTDGGLFIGLLLWGRRRRCGCGGGCRWWCVNGQKARRRVEALDTLGVALLRNLFIVQLVLVPSQRIRRLGLEPGRHCVF